jgi:GxxExxY protein
MTLDEIGKIIVDASFEVHKTLGPGLLESAYEACLKHELSLRGINFVS